MIGMEIRAGQDEGAAGRWRRGATASLFHVNLDDRRIGGADHIDRHRLPGIGHERGLDWIEASARPKSTAPNDIRNENRRKVERLMAGLLSWR